MMKTLQESIMDDDEELSSSISELTLKEEFRDAIMKDTVNAFLKKYDLIPEHRQWLYYCSSRKLKYTDFEVTRISLSQLRTILYYARMKYSSKRDEEQEPLDEPIGITYTPSENKVTITSDMDKDSQFIKKLIDICKKMGLKQNPTYRFEFYYQGTL